MDLGKSIIIVTIKLYQLPTKLRNIELIILLILIYNKQKKYLYNIIYSNLFYLIIFILCII